MDNVGIVVDDIETTIDFFRELGLELEGRAVTGKQIERPNLVCCGVEGFNRPGEEDRPRVRT